MLLLTSLTTVSAIVLASPSSVAAVAPPDVGEPVCVNPGPNPYLSSDLGCLLLSPSGLPTVTVSGDVTGGFTAVVDTGGIRACIDRADDGPCYDSVIIGGQGGANR